MNYCDAVTKSHYVCTKPAGHDGKHEAWDGDPAQHAAAKCIVAWGGPKHRWERPWWGYFFFDERCSKCLVRRFSVRRGPRRGIVYELRYPDGSKVTAGTRAMPECRGTR